jgi:hypothetical protein
MDHPQNNEQQHHLMKKKALTKDLQTEEESEKADIKALDEEAKN